MQKNLAVSSSPHLRDHVSTRRIMQEVCLALAPAGIAGIILFGSQAAVLIAASVISAVLAEYFYQKLTHQKVTVGDWSAVVTGLLRLGSFVFGLLPNGAAVSRRCCWYAAAAASITREGTAGTRCARRLRSPSPDWGGT